MNRLAIVALAIGACSCALGSRGAVLSVRYFSPAAPSAAPVAAAPSKPVVRLGRVRGAQHLRERIAHRESPYEVGFYDDREWTERPEDYVRRALARKLFEERGFARATGRAAPTLDVEVLGFEEIRMAPVHAARVELRYQLENDGAVLEERTVTIDRAVPDGGFENFVAAISAALDTAAARIADRIVEITN
jgi:cholesterol transport system auxiliary component